MNVPITFSLEDMVNLPEGTFIDALAGELLMGGKIRYGLRSGTYTLGDYEIPVEYVFDSYQEAEKMAKKLWKSTGIPYFIWTLADEVWKDFSSYLPQAFNLLGKLYELYRNIGYTVTYPVIGVDGQLTYMVTIEEKSPDSAGRTITIYHPLLPLAITRACLGWLYVKNDGDLHSENSYFIGLWPDMKDNNLE